MQTCIVKPVQSIRASGLLEGDQLLGPVSGRAHRIRAIYDRGRTVIIYRTGISSPLHLPAERIVRIIPG